jgi:hypothetical protein
LLVRHDLTRDLERKHHQPQAPAPAREQLSEREQLAGAIGNNAMQRAAASTDLAPAGLLSGAPMSIARFSGASMAQRPTGALREYEEEQYAPEGPHETAPAEPSAPAEAPAPEPETLEPVEEAEPGNYNALEESYI